MTADDDFPLEVVASLGGRPIVPIAAAAAVAARLQASAGLVAMRSVVLPLVDAIEPGHHTARLQSFVACPSEPDGSEQP